MKCICPACMQAIEVETIDIVDERVVECPTCTRHFQVLLKPDAKHEVEKSNEEILSYMSQYPHDQRLFEHLPSGVKNTFD